MVFFQSLIGLAVASLAVAAPMPDSAIGGEVAVSAPNGIPLSDTAELASQTAAYKQAYASQSATSSAMESMMTESSSNSYGSGSSGYGSSGYGSSGYGGSGYGSSDSSYGSNSGYGSSDSGYGSNNYQSSSAMATSSSMYESKMMATSTMMETSAMATSTAMAYSTASYGSGSSSWGGSGYQDCVNQCIAQFGTPASYMPTATGSSEGSYGSGATHTVVVAPTQGVLRYVPFMVNASVGDTIKFMWGANNHTVTKGTSLGVCNKSENALFTSGEHNKDFVFTQVVNDTNPTFFYCATPGHCEKGMFGIINPPMASAGSNMSVSSMMSSMVSNNSQMAAMWSYTKNMTAGSPAAAAWGSNADMSNMPSWAQQAMVENVMYTRLVLAANPETIDSNGQVNLGAGGDAPLMLPQDITAVMNNAGSSAAASSPSATGAGSSTAASSSPSPSHTSGARSLASSSAAVALSAGLAAFFLL
ncbi:hypothetical protein GLOTRDRAFT_136925 [Gloeophyllum trabeum ATCC 11539]|uniref:Phytocyanin domain-containing protein n=1 Tax=Gloeophyllum trabeum (strain ATCC 11539 / FP-39264 / Madison 617) TaxID=670483 RepID=S7RXR1_GLOTA|nr:uncharacterized protein GLOTRDRAFT_136925 [Gloeophyllum trabeum ATCC 11539]EPQ58159.1 hypothetical protein GLOTRDRAFT_136925 [Gloeophyllum trabeum ATCC 11539]